MKVILFGYRACGKSTLGKRLAAETWDKFYDTDELICQEFPGLTIAQIWQTHGEKAFRDKENQITQELCKLSSGIISLGGGTLMQPEAKEAVAACSDAKKVYMYCATEELYRRISLDEKSKDTRPDLTQEGGLAEVENVLKLRDPVYREVADSVFDVSELNEEKAFKYMMQNHL